ncbi:MAG: HlyD family secretion protein, partial [Rhodocyclaceae bacterium]|nr:HlyD family secretion protein [Rhodocyclaceae bacterium]
EKAAELAYSGQLLERVRVKAPRDGIAVFSDTRDWLGKAVTTGERVLQIADPARAEMSLRLPVGDAIELAPDASVTLYLTTAPQYAYEGRLSYAAYRAEVAPDGMLAYKLKADFAQGETPPRIGLTGTAKVYGGWVPLAYYVLRRPLAALRQRLGW